MAPTVPSTALEDIKTSEYPSVHSFGENNYILKVLGSGSFATVYASIPKDIADPILTLYKASDRSSQAVDQACSNLRTAIQAVKVASNDSSTRSRDCLPKEIETLRYIRGLRASNLPALLGYDEHNLKSWYALEPPTGGTLNQYVKRGYSSRDINLQVRYPPISFIWHVIAQLAEALCLYQFGTTNNQRYHTHGDMSESNIMFNSPSAVSYKDYPDAFITDFGSGTALDFETATAFEKEQFFYKQRKDVENLILYCQSLMKPEDRIGLIERIFQDLRRTQHNGSLKKWLQKLIRTASKVRDETYQPLSEQTVSYFSRPLLTNEELLEVSKTLRKKPRVQQCDIL